MKKIQKLLALINKRIPRIEKNKLLKWNISSIKKFFVFFSFFVFVCSLKCNLFGFSQKFFFLSILVKALFYPFALLLVNKLILRFFSFLFLMFILLFLLFFILLFSYIKFFFIYFNFEKFFLFFNKTDFSLIVNVCKFSSCFLKFSLNLTFFLHLNFFTCFFARKGKFPFQGFSLFFFTFSFIFYSSS